MIVALIELELWSLSDCCLIFAEFLMSNVGEAVVRVIMCGELVIAALIEREFWRFLNCQIVVYAEMMMLIMSEAVARNIFKVTDNEMLSRFLDCVFDYRTLLFFSSFERL